MASVTYINGYLCTSRTIGPISIEKAEEMIDEILKKETGCHEVSFDKDGNKVVKIKVVDTLMTWYDKIILKYNDNSVYMHIRC